MPGPGSWRAQQRRSPAPDPVMKWQGMIRGWFRGRSEGLWAAREGHLRLVACFTGSGGGWQAPVLKVMSMDLITGPLWQPPLPLRPPARPQPLPAPASAAGLAGPPALGGAGGDRATERAHQRGRAPFTHAVGTLLLRVMHRSKWRPSAQPGCPPANRGGAHLRREGGRVVQEQLGRGHHHRAVGVVQPEVQHLLAV